MPETRPTQAVAEEGGDVQPSVGRPSRPAHPLRDHEWARFEHRIEKILEGTSKPGEGGRR